MLNYSATFAISFLLSMYLQRILGFTSRAPDWYCYFSPY